MENSPVSKNKTLSPTFNVFTIAASQAPVPEPGNIITGCDVLKTVFNFSNTLLEISPNSGPR